MHKPTGQYQLYLLQIHHQNHPRCSEEHSRCPKELAAAPSPPADLSFHRNARATWGKWHSASGRCKGKTPLDFSQAVRPGCWNSEEINIHAALWSCSQRNRAATSLSENGERLHRGKAAGFRQSCLEGALAGVPQRHGVWCESQTPLLMEEGDVAFQECLESDKKFNWDLRQLFYFLCNSTLTYLAGITTLQGENSSLLYFWNLCIFMCSISLLANASF